MGTLRRDFLRMLGAGAAAAAVPHRAWADRIRVLPEAGGADPTIALGQVSPDFQRFVGSVRAGAAAQGGGLGVLWLHGPPAAPLEVRTLDEARQAGDLLIAERAQAAVPELIVDNRGPFHVLLLGGEILVGGKQNRVLREDILLPPFSGPRPIGVYCVEQGRWTEGRRDFESRGAFAQPGLRSQVMHQAPQDRVWQEVGRAARAAEAPSPTGSYQAVWDKPEVKTHLDGVGRGLHARPPDGALGAAVFLGRALGGLDLFHSPGLFRRAWPKLLRAYALEAYTVRGGTGWDEPAARARVEGLLRAAARTEGTLRGNAGVGRLLEFRVEGARGAALLYRGRAVHTAIL